MHINNVKSIDFRATTAGSPTQLFRVNNVKSVDFRATTAGSPTQHINNVKSFDFRATTAGSPTQLFSTLMILKAACMHNQCYIDRLITTFMKVLHKMAREHLTPTTSETSPGMVPCHNDCITYYFILHV